VHLRVQVARVAPAFAGAGLRDVVAVMRGILGFLLPSRFVSSVPLFPQRGIATIRCTKDFRSGC